MLFFLYLELP
jgi:hypothetical protein